MLNYGESITGELLVSTNDGTADSLMVAVGSQCYLLYVFLDCYSMTY